MDAIGINEQCDLLEKEEILAAIRRGLLEVKEARRTGKRLMSAQELLNEL
jgi:methionyl-tRNA formyltransferase